jgi:UDP-N-acetylglucosamine 4,6-dehydratase
MVDIFQGKNILITGGTGSIGSEIARNILLYEPKVIRILSNDENGLFNLEQELGGNINTRFLLGDVRDKERIEKAIEGIDIVFHAAALKQVPFCEYNPFEAIKTNVIGTQNVLEASLTEEVQSVIFISTDKAVNPVSTMGATKLLAEKLVIDANYYKGNRKTIFSSVRFGNVIGSRGSVFPFFAGQIRRGGPVTITDPSMSRFIMSPKQVIGLLFRASGMAIGGEIFILKMPSLKISDLIETMINELAPKFGYQPAQIKVESTGIRPGEKTYEELMTEEEATHAQETDEMFIVMPRIELSTSRIEDYDYPESKPAQVKQFASNSGSFLTQEEIKMMLKEDFLSEILSP